MSVSYPTHSCLVSILQQYSTHSNATHYSPHAPKAADQLGLQYVTERILASVLPARSRTSASSAATQSPTPPDHHHHSDAMPTDDDDNDRVQLRRRPANLQLSMAANNAGGNTNADDHHNDAGNADDGRSDIYERELIQMLEQKHGRNYKLFDLESCIATVTLERLCELCKHMDAWLNGGRDKVVVLQDR